MFIYIKRKKRNVFVEKKTKTIMLFFVHSIALKLYNCSLYDFNINNVSKTFSSFQ